MGYKMRTKNHTYVQIVSLAISGALLAGCSTAHVSQNNIDNMKEVDNQSHKLMTTRIDQESKKFMDESQSLYKEIQKIPKVEPEVVVVEPVFNPLDAVQISVNVNNGDVQSVLHAISDQAGMSLLMDPQLSELKRKISMHLKNVPASLVFNQVMELLDFDGQVKGNVLIVRPYREKVYELNFLQTSTTIDYSMGGDVFGANSNSNGGSGSNGGNKPMTGSLAFKGTGATQSNPYTQLSETLEDILGRKKVSEQENTIPGVNTQIPNMMGRLPSPIKEKPKGFQPIYSLNEMTGTLYLKARPSQVEAVDQLITQYKSVLSRQVLIEAQLLDVRLGDGNQYGVDWNKLGEDIAYNYGAGSVDLGSVTNTLIGTGNQVRSITIPANSYGVDGATNLKLVHSANTFSVALQALQQFGSLRVLSNPSIRAKNARPAFISVGRNSQYISESTSTVNNVGGSLTTTSDVSTSSVFDGIILGFEPFIDSDGKISLTIHPMQSNVDKASMALVDVGNGTKITLPVIDFKGLTTSLSLKDGDTVILGGLMDEVATDSGEGVPGLNEIPGIGALFGGNRLHDKETRELVMVLRVTIL
ncbi:pilus (MSHA type) biogenesis protein MshL [Thiomicrorhabdus immobilis]|uniref:Pilus (MSHA type) biogenesis protein MshL n=2 Tax=Thiomicrorhabdus immobilis TaxID=2791037 RepID=A0ABM7MFT0_9GAMM|nr:pilus (MSHA type) biogenesis protein MshL [Thiomicrorhabdus immobilis]